MRGQGAQLSLSSTTEILASHGVRGKVQRSLATLAGALPVAREQSGVQQGSEATSQIPVYAVRLL